MTSLIHALSALVDTPVGVSHIQPFQSHSLFGLQDIGAVELPLTHHELYRQIGIDPPRGVLLYGPPGTGKTMLAKAVAHHTTAAFIRVVGSEFVQKYLGEVSILASGFLLRPACDCHHTGHDQ